MRRIHSIAGMHRQRQEKRPREHRNRDDTFEIWTEIYDRYGYEKRRSRNKFRWTNPLGSGWNVRLATEETAENSIAFTDPARQ